MFSTLFFTFGTLVDANLDDEEVTIYFIKKLRKKKFDSAEALIAQITRDIAEAKTVPAENLDCVDLGI